MLVCGLAARHLSGGTVGPPARWAATSNVEGGSVTEEEVHCPLAREGWLYTRINYLHGLRVPSYATAHGAGLPN